MGFFNVSFILGWGTGTVMGGAANDAMGMDAAFLAMTGLSAAGFLVVLLFLPARASSADRVREADPHTSYAAMLRDDAMRALLVFQLAWGLSFGAVFSFLAVFMTSVLAASTMKVGVALSTRSILNGLLMGPFGWLADRASRRVLVTMGMCMTALGTLLIPWMQSYTMILVLFLVIGTFESMAIPATSAIAVERGRGMGMGSVMGVSNMAMSVGMIGGSLVGGGLEGAFGIAWVFRYATAVVLLGIVGFNIFLLRAAKQVAKEPAIAGRSGAAP